MANKGSESAARKRPVLMVIDGHSMVYRAYHVLAVRTPMNLRSTGEPIGAVFGFANMLLRAWGDVQPDYWAMAFDTAGPTFRDEIYADYKAGRPAMPDELAAQFGRVRQLLDSLRMPVLELEGYEADDIIGTLGRMATERDIDTIILTGDTDELQLVSPHVRVRLTTGQADTRVYDEEQVRQRYGIEPRQLIDYKALKGDSSDNIPGVPGVGDKAASHLLQQYGTIEEMFQRIDEVTAPRMPRIQELLKDHQEQIERDRTLVTIVTSLPIEFDFEQARTDRYERSRAVELFQELEFTSLISRLPGSDDGVTAPASRAAATPVAERRYETVDTDEALDSLVETLAATGRFSLDCVGTSDLSMQAELVGLAFSTEPGAAWYVPFGHQLGTQVASERVLERLKPLLEDANVKKVVHNGKFDTTVLSNRDIQLRGLEADVTIAAYLLGAKSLTMKGQAFERLGDELQAATDITGSGAKAITMAQALIDQVTPFACARADCGGRLWPLYEPELEKEGLTSLFHDMEMALLPVLERMERLGVAVEVELLHQMSREMTDQLLAVEKAAYDSVGHMFKINSPKELSSLLFEELGLPSGKRTKQAYSTDAQVLERLRELHPVVGQVLEYRQISKIKSTYVDALPRMVNPKTGRVHTTFSQTVAATGRLSSSDPNLQNIPVRTAMGRRVREAFVAVDRPSWCLLSADYSQIELRILAHMTQDPALIDAFRRDEDIHAATAARVYDVPLAEVTAEQRRFAKVVNFGLIYGMGEFGLATRADLSREVAGPIIEEYFRKYPGIQQYLDETKRTAHQLGYVQTLCGRRRYIPELKAANRQIRSSGERMAVNMPIQGTAADIMKIGMIQVQQEMDRLGLESRMTLQVHDELIFETPENEIETLQGMLLEVLPAAMELVVPLKVDLKRGRTWGEME